MNRSRTQGFTLIEVMVYLVVIVIFLELAYGCYFRYDYSSRRMQQNALDIARATRAGERWRADVREAIAPPRLVDGKLMIARTNGAVAYWFAEGQVWRRANGQATPLLPAVKSSVMEKDARQRVVAWRWELELATARKDAALRPLFTFEAVAPFRE